VGPCKSEVVIESVALRDSDVPAENTGRVEGTEMPSSAWRRERTSTAVLKSPGEPARCGVVAYWREAARALAGLGTVLQDGVNHEDVDGLNLQITHKKTCSATFPKGTFLCSSFPVVRPPKACAIQMPSLPMIS